MNRLISNVARARVHEGRFPNLLYSIRLMDVTKEVIHWLNSLLDFLQECSITSLESIAAEIKDLVRWSVSHQDVCVGWNGLPLRFRLLITFE